VTYKVTIPYGLVGIIGAVFLGLGRALGETMAVTFVIGNAHRIAASVFAPSNTIASTLANEFTEATTPLYISSLVALGLVLFVITYLVQVISQMLLRRMYRAWSVGL
jgi:phosphate transport system permease protein